MRAAIKNLSSSDLLKHVQTLVLDGLSVTSDFCYEIITDSSYNVRILSLRGVKHLNSWKLKAALLYACRKSREDDGPTLKALYYFGQPDSISVRYGSSDPAIGTEWNQRSQLALTQSLQPQDDPWWSTKGRIITRADSSEWANCLQACEGNIIFDAVLCRGPRHHNSPVFGKTHARGDNAPEIAQFSLPGCASCGKAPEGLVTTKSQDRSSFPLLGPVPILSSSVAAAITPRNVTDTFVPRCKECLKKRHCDVCTRWWCETCYDPEAGRYTGRLATESSMQATEDNRSTNLENNGDEESYHKNTLKVRGRQCWKCTYRSSRITRITKKA